MSADKIYGNDMVMLSAFLKKILKKETAEQNLQFSFLKWFLKCTYLL